MVTPARHNAFCGVPGNLDDAVAENGLCPQRPPSVTGGRRLPIQLDREIAVAAIAAPSAGILERELADDAGVINDRAGSVETGGEAQVDLVGAVAEDAGGNANVHGAGAGGEVVERVGAGVVAVALVDDRAVETLQRHVAVETGHAGGRLVVDGDADRVIAVETGGGLGAGLAAGDDAADMERAGG